MAVNPAEDIVNVWLQDNLGYFTRQNINVPKGTRTSHGKEIHGGKGKEIDILGINNQDQRIWVEVTVSPNPYQDRSAERVEKALEVVNNKFHDEKKVIVEQIFGGKKYQRIFVYSHKIFSRKQEISDKEKEFLQKVNNLGIDAKRFDYIFQETINRINHYSVDPTRIYLYYAKFFLPKK